MSGCVCHEVTVVAAVIGANSTAVALIWSSALLLMLLYEDDTLATAVYVVAGTAVGAVAALPRGNNHRAAIVAACPDG